MRESVPLTSFMHFGVAVAAAVAVLVVAGCGCAQPARRATKAAPVRILIMTSLSQCL